MGDPQGHLDAGALHLGFRDAQEVRGRQFLLEDDEDSGLDAVVVGGTVGVEVTEVGGEPGGHRCGADGAALPLEEEGPDAAFVAQEAEGVGVDRARAARTGGQAAVSEVPGRAVGRVELHHLPVPGAGLAGEGGDEGVDGGGVVQVPQQLAAAPAGDIAPVPVSAGIYLFDDPLDYLDDAADSIVGADNNLPAVNEIGGQERTLSGHKIDGTITN